MTLAKTIVLTLIFIMFAAFGYGQKYKHQNASDTLTLGSVQKRMTHYPIVGFKIGTDLGAATPFPFKYIPSKMAPKIHPKMTLGANITIPLSPQISITAEVNYKKLNLSANAMVKDQQFTDFADPEKPFVTYFTGQATMDMYFNLLELPLYFRYTFKKKNNSIAIGGYYAFVKDAAFETIAKKGMMGKFPGDKDPAILDLQQVMSFTNDLDKWDAGVVFGYRRRVIKWIFVDAMAYVGLKSIFTPDFNGLEYKMYPIRGSFGISCDIDAFNK